MLPRYVTIMETPVIWPMKVKAIETEITFIIGSMRHTYSMCWKGVITIGGPGAEYRFLNLEESERSSSSFDTASLAEHVSMHIKAQ